MTLTYDLLLQHGFDQGRAKRALAYSSLFAGDWPDFVRQVSEMLNCKTLLHPIR